MPAFFWVADLKAHELLKEILQELKQIQRMLETATPSSIAFKEITMLPADPGNTLVFTGTLSPAGSAFPAGTTFSAASADPQVTVTVDPTGLIVTASISASAVPGTVADISWSTSTFTPQPAGSPSQLTATIPLTIGALPTPTPTSVSFAQTT